VLQVDLRKREREREMSCSMEDHDSSGACADYGDSEHLTPTKTVSARTLTLSLL
jgi:hypothetical protein